MKVLATCTVSRDEWFEHHLKPGGFKTPARRWHKKEWRAFAPPVIRLAQFSYHDDEPERFVIRRIFSTGIESSAEQTRKWPSHNTYSTLFSKSDPEGARQHFEKTCSKTFPWHDFKWPMRQRQVLSGTRRR